MSLAQHRFRLDQDEMNELTSFEHVAKVIKVLMYKIGLTYKRQDLYRQELLDKIEESSKDQLEVVQKDIYSLNQTMALVNEEL